ncbi:GCN5 family N-acetyltransferase [Flavimobilis marinus]|uniref:Protein N-acetyltransferase, RimJ/RimL family n=1 Tax=Flavimobilis marinus TaxID=285351 RepID=A0A1I2H262_9MICO|nr:GNAT family protein [Flavimobilis marinus]GHG54350.1 GCN5 family N-acetyltransferase [Flavimobilis marinus]SFF24195.1 Protein N-acetyltransferase, RimJ/RimL family [Flavimobilis marinus]
MEHDLVLTGHGVRLEPLGVQHAAALAPLVDAEMWRGMTSPLPDDEAAMTAHVERLVATPAMVAFAVRDEHTDGSPVVGVTTYYDVASAMGRCEIGNTFYGRAVWGTHVNPAAKLLLLTHAFEDWGLARVALRGDARNARSLAAMRKLGARYEGTLRDHRVSADGTRQDTVYFSILAAEWPTVRDGLLARLGDAG